MKTCEQYEDMISAFIDGALAEEDRLSLMEHMPSCPACQAYFDQQIAMHDALMADAENIKTTKDFAEEVMAQVRFTPQPRRKSPRWQQWAALAACCAIAAAGLWFGVDQWTPQDTTATSQTYDCATPTDSLNGVSRAMQESMDEGASYTETNTAYDESDIQTAAGTAPALNSAPPPASAAGSSSGASAPDTAVAAKQETADELPTDAKAYAEASSVDGVAETPPAEPQENIMPLFDGQEAETLASGVLTTASPVAAAWVEETLGLSWTAGRHYELSAGEYSQLLEILLSAGEEFSQQPGLESGEGFLLIAENSSETD